MGAYVLVVVLILFCCADAFIHLAFPEGATSIDTDNRVVTYTSNFARSDYMRSVEVGLRFHPGVEKLAIINEDGINCDAISLTSSNYTYTTHLAIPAGLERNQAIISLSHAFRPGKHSLLFYTEKGYILEEASFEIKILYKFAPPFSNCVPATRDTGGRPVCDHYSIGKGTYHDLKTDIKSRHPWNITIGKFTSIAKAKLNLYRTSMHRMGFVTTYPIHGMVDWESSVTDEIVHGNSHTVLIGNDVWIGNDAVLYNNLTIGHGAVIGGESVVRKSVPPYAIVYGNPATIVRYRFPPDVIEKLLRMQWWDWEDERIFNMAQYSTAEDVIAAWEHGQI